MDLHFISGLPRSGSTLLSAIFNQNPKFFAGIISPLAGIMGDVIEKMSPGYEPSLSFPTPQKKSVLNGVINGFYSGVRGDETIFDTNRSWTARMALIQEFFQDATVFCLIRSYAEIVSSLEWMYNKHPMNATALYGYKAGLNVYDRVERLTGPDGVVGYASNALREAVYGPHAGHLCLISYNALARRPNFVIDRIYARLGVPLYKHNFMDVRFEDRQFDNKLGLPGLHTVHGPVTPSAKPTILPPDIVARLNNESEWMNGPLPCQVIC